MSDLIDRQAAIDAARDWYEGLICGSFKGLEKRLRALPPAEPKRGKWIEITNSRCVVVALRCSRCEKSPRHGVRSDFCPNCGAEMEVTE